MSGESGELPASSVRTKALKHRPRPFCHGPLAAQECGVVSVMDFGAKADGVTDDGLRALCGDDAELRRRAIAAGAKPVVFAEA